MSEKSSPYAIHETLPVGLLLTAVGGFLEAYTYLLRGGVFCNAQTGNIVLLGLSLAQKDIAQALYYPLPILAFVLGIWLSSVIQERMTVREALHWIHILVVIEIICLFFIGFMPQGPADNIANVIVAFICSLQYNTFRKVNGIPYASTFCTNNLRMTTENLYRLIKHKDRASGRNFLHYSLILLTFFAGAFFGTVAIRFWHIRAVWICCLILMVVLIILIFHYFYQKRKATLTSCEN